MATIHLGDEESALGIDNCPHRQVTGLLRTSAGVDHELLERGICASVPRILIEPWRRFKFHYPKRLRKLIA